MISDHRLRLGRLSIYVKPADLWVGVYIARRAVYVCPLPCLVFKWARVGPWTYAYRDEIARRGQEVVTRPRAGEPP